MSAQACLGCGKSLPPGSGRGRRARYHGPACRQRARRARLQVEQGRAWEALERADSAVVTARRAMTNGADATPAVQALVSAADDLAELHGITGTGSAAVSSSDDCAPSVTQSITKQAHVGRRRKQVEAEPEDVTAVAVTSDRVELPPAIKPRETVDTDTVRMERIPSPDGDNRSKMVLAGHGDGVRLVGFLEPQGIQQKKWDAFTPGWTRLDGGPFRTRQDALLRLLRLHVPFRLRR
jgi:hypothetical protein